MTALRADRYSQAEMLSTRSSASEAMLRTMTSWVMSSASSGSPTRARTNRRNRTRVSAQSWSRRSITLSLRALFIGILRLSILGTMPVEEGRIHLRRGASLGRLVRLQGRAPHNGGGRSRGGPMISRIQLALNVRDVESAARFYADLFGVRPAKQ